MSSTKCRLVIDPYFSTLTGYQHDADQKRTITTQKMLSRAQRVPNPPDGAIDTWLGQKPVSTESC
jgi:hypothetical protein